jgi:DNA-binding CsgD family transcriptional regulator
MIAPVAAVGRDDILAAARDQLPAAGVILAGPAGIGKTVVWQHLLAELPAGARVLRAAPAETERALAYSALADLIGPLTEPAEQLTGSARAAFATVIGSADGPERVEERAVAMMVRDLLDLAVGEAPATVLAIDDCQWLDPPSERSLRFALRRVTHRPRLLLTIRDPNSGASLPLGLGDWHPAPALLLVPALGVASLHHVLKAQLGTVFPRPLLTRIAGESDGNPLIALEIGRALLQAPALPHPGDDLPVAGSAVALIRERLERLNTGTVLALRLVSLLTVPTVGELRALGVDLDDLDPAEEDGLITVSGDHLRFGHPMHATAVRAGIPAGLRRRLHARLAQAVGDPDERVRHLVKAVDRPDAPAAVEVEESARRHWFRGAPGLAADLFDEAAALTPKADRQARARRLLAGVRSRYDSGDHAATDAAAAAAAAALDGDDRAEALLLRAMVGFVTVGHPVAIEFAQEALTAATPGGAVAGRIHAHLGVFEDAPMAAAEHARIALELPVSADEAAELRSSALFIQFYNEVRAGLPTRLELLADGLALEAGTPAWLAGSIPGLWWTAVDDHARARERMAEHLAVAVARGDEPLHLEVLLHLIQSFVVSGEFGAARTQLAVARVLAEQVGGGLDQVDFLDAQVGLHSSESARWASVVAAGLRRAHDQQDPWARRVYGMLDGQLALHSGEYRRAAEAFSVFAAAIDAQGLAEPLGSRWEPDAIEASVGCGDLEAARRVLTRLAQRHARLPRPWTALGLARSRALIVAAEGGDPAEALAGLGSARAGVPPGVLPLDRARCLLTAGLVHRRVRQRGRAREALQLAVAEFDAIGAGLLAGRARRELDRSGVRTHGLDELTATEQRVAERAAQGATNREIADALYISAKTVEANLARTYRKLGISRRAELATALARTAVDAGE